jgi:phage baseplate assembly protein W
MATSTLPATFIFTKKERAYSIDVNQSPFDGQYGDVVFDEASVRQSLGNLILGYVGCKSRIFNQTFGSQTYNFLQEPLDHVTAAKIKQSLLQAISKWEDRVRVTASDVSVMTDRRNARYRITINYRVLATEATGSAVFNLKPSGF